MALLLKYPKDFLIEGEYVVLKPDVSEEEFWAISDEDSNFELIDGVLIIHSPASEEHEDIFRYLQTILTLFLEKTKQGKIYGSRFVMRLSKKWNPEPDLIIIQPENYKNIKYNYFEGPADIAIEILSKATKEIDLQKKIPKYLEVGVKEVWVMDPEDKKISIRSPNQVIEYTDPNSDRKIESGILKGLPIEIRWIWNREKHPIIEVVKNIL
ncbi:MAG: Uma2 family endonuclease [Candidatus Sigynarchaeota archaeon]